MYVALLSLYNPVITYSTIKGAIFYGGMQPFMDIICSCVFVQGITRVGYCPLCIL